MPLLSGMTWNHPRGLNSLRRTTEEFNASHPDVDVRWNARSLREFEDVPVRELAQSYDLIAIDHPFVGQAAETGALVKLDELLSAELLADQRDHTVGPSYRSYTMGGHLWAVAMDAAAQVSAYRPDLLTEPPPNTWEDTFDLLRAMPANLRVEIPANPTHLWATFMTLCHHVATQIEPANGAMQPSGTPAWWPAKGIISEVAVTAFERLSTLLEYVDPVSFTRDPITTLDAMAEGAPVAYVPLIFGYSNYSRVGYGKHLVKFADAPSPDDTTAGTMLGGVGLAVSAYCSDVSAAAALAAWIVSEDCQRSVHVRAGGQPAHRAAWKDPEANALTNDFFISTLATLDSSFIRPRTTYYPAYQRQAGELLHKRVRQRASSTLVVEELTDLWHVVGGPDEMEDS